MQALGIPRATGGVFFAQLLGMCDQLTFPLGQAGFKVLKYLPYGPIEEVLPYLIRRAQENSALTGGSKTELKMLQRELLRRCLPKRLFARSPTLDVRVDGWNGIHVREASCSIEKPKLVHG